MRKNLTVPFFLANPVYYGQNREKVVKMAKINVKKQHFFTGPK